MQVLATQFSLDAGALDVFFAGCLQPTCDGCHNPESHDPSGGRAYSPAMLASVISTKAWENSRLVSKIRLFGGEPLDQPHDELYDFINGLKCLKKEIWLFTRYEVYDIPFRLRIMFNYIKTGRYIKDMPSGLEVYGVKLASANQQVLKRGINY